MWSGVGGHKKKLYMPSMGQSMGSSPREARVRLQGLHMGGAFMCLGKERGFTEAATWRLIRKGQESFQWANRRQKARAHKWFQSRKQHWWGELMMSEGLTGIPPNSILPGTSEHELVWKWSLCRCVHIKMRPYEVRMGPESND